MAFTWKNRPQAVIKEIENKFSKLSVYKESNSIFNGANSYALAGIDEVSLIWNYIGTNLDIQKEFYILDIGAGNGELSQTIA